MRTNISIFKYFLPLILAALFTTTANADLLVWDSYDDNITESFYGEEELWKSYFTPGQWNALKDEAGLLQLNGSNSYLAFSSQFDFVGVDAEGVRRDLSVQFSSSDDSSRTFYVSRIGNTEYTEEDDSSWSGFVLAFGEDGILSSLKFQFYTPAGGEEFYEVAFGTAGGGTPEPATLLILGTGLVVLGLSARRKRK